MLIAGQDSSTSYLSSLVVLRVPNAPSHFLHRSSLNCLYCQRIIMWLSNLPLLVSIVPLASAWPTNAGQVLASKIPLKNFGEFATLTLEEAINHAQLLDSLSSVDDTSSNAKVATSAVQQASSSTSSCTSPRTRIEWRNYSTADREAFVNSISCLTKLPSAGAAYSPSTSRYEDFVQTHQKMTSSVHGNGIFLLWHRYFVYLFEQALRTECGLNSAMPWWDETLDTGKFHLSSLFTSSYFGTMLEATDETGTCVVDGKFANLTLHIGPGTNNVVHCLSRALNESRTAQSSITYVNHCARQSVYGGFESCAEAG